MKAKEKKEALIRLFATQADWTAWLEKNHHHQDGLWLRIAKKDSGLKSVTYLEAIEIALCYGWIDGLKRPESEKAWLQRFVPRRPKSLWSRINREKAEALITSGRMKDPGMEAIKLAQSDGRWETAYDSAKNSKVPPDFQAALGNCSKAQKCFEGLDGTNRYAVLFRIQTATKPETRTRKIEQMVELLKNNKRIHEPRRQSKK
jgi:uncharacterized protein YdeI (YjbR/CyaY-like superfamily)